MKNKLCRLTYYWRNKYTDWKKSFEEEMPIKIGIDKYKKYKQSWHNRVTLEIK
jgi:hypothetical protein